MERNHSAWLMLNTPDSPTLQMSSAGPKALPSWDEMSFVHAVVNSSFCFLSRCCRCYWCRVAPWALLVFNFLVNSMRLSWYIARCYAAEPVSNPKCCERKKTECDAPLFSSEQFSNLFDLWKIPCHGCVCFEQNLGSVQLFSRDVLFCPVHPSRTDCTLQLDRALDSRCECRFTLTLWHSAFHEAQILPQKQLWQLWFKWLTGNHSAGGWWQRINFDWMVASSCPMCIYLLDGWTRALFPVNGWCKSPTRTVLW